LSFLLDTNVISEWTKPQPDPGVIKWLAGLDEDQAFLSVISFAEIRRGVEKMPRGRKRVHIETWLQNDLPARFELRILPIDEVIAQLWGIVMDRSARQGKTIGAMDAFLAATALDRDLTLVTRNTKDFGGLEVKLLNPWSESSR